MSEQSITPVEYTRHSRKVSLHVSDLNRETGTFKAQLLYQRDANDATLQAVANSMGAHTNREHERLHYSYGYQLYWSPSLINPSVSTQACLGGEVNFQKVSEESEMPTLNRTRHLFLHQSRGNSESLAPTAEFPLVSTQYSSTANPDSVVRVAPQSSQTGSRIPTTEFSTGFASTLQDTFHESAAQGLGKEHGVFDKVARPDASRTIKAPEDEEAVAPSLAHTHWDNYEGTLRHLGSSLNLLNPALYPSSEKLEQTGTVTPTVLLVPDNPNARCKDITMSEIVPYRSELGENWGLKDTAMLEGKLSFLMPTNMLGH